MIPYTDRLNYCSALINNLPFAMAVEKLLGIEITRVASSCVRAFVRVLAACRPLTCVAAPLMELGAMTAFLYLVMIRDYIYEHLARR